MESSSQTPRVAPTVYTIMGEVVSAEAVIVISSVGVKASASAEVAERVRSSETVVYVAYTVLEGQGNRCSMRSVRSEELAGQKQV